MKTNRFNIAVLTLAAISLNAGPRNGCRMRLTMKTQVL